MKGLPSVIFLLSAFAVLSGCNSTPKASMSTLRLNNPEVNSKPLKVNLAVGHGSRSEIYLEDENTDSDDINVFARASVSISNGWQVSIQDESDEAYSVAVQYQFYGDNADKADRGNFSQAIRLGYEGKVSGRGDKDTNLENNTYWEHKTNIFDISWILGYRFNKNLIMYGGPFYYNGSLKGQYKPELEQSQIIELDEDGKQYGANVAIEYRFNNGIGLSGEFIVTEASWGDYSHGSSNANFKFDYQF